MLFFQKPQEMLIFSKARKGKNYVNYQYCGDAHCNLATLPLFRGSQDHVQKYENCAGLEKCHRSCQDIY